MLSILDYIILILLCVWFLGAVLYLRHRRKQGRRIGCSGCCGECCSSCRSCQHTKS